MRTTRSWSLPFVPISFGLGALAALLTYFNQAVTHACSCLSGKMTVFYGYPWYWYMAASSGGRILAGHFLPETFLADTAFWTVALSAMILLILRTRRKAVKQSTSGI